MVDAAIKQTYPMTVAFASGHGSYEQIQGAFRRLYLWTEHHMLVPTGMPVGVYFDDPLETPVADLRWEIWAPVAEGSTPLETSEDDFGVKIVEACTVASVMHRGPYDTIGAVYAELADWASASGYTISGPPRETYYSDSDEVEIEETITELQFPVCPA